MATFVLSSYGKEIVTLGLTKEPITSLGNFNVTPHVSIDEVDPADVAVLLIPGGKPETVSGNKKLDALLQQLNDKKAVVGAICAAPLILAAAGILKGNKFTTVLNVKEWPQFDGGEFIKKDVVVDDNIVTSIGYAYVEFAVAVAQRLGLIEDEEQIPMLINTLKNIKE